MEKSIIKLSSKEDLSIFWKEMPENCVKVQKQHKGAWVGSYDSEIWLICKDKDEKVVKIIPANELPFDIDWTGVPMDDRYSMTPTIKR